MILPSAAALFLSTGLLLGWLFFKGGYSTANYLPSPVLAATMSVLIYPSLWTRRFPDGNRDNDSQAAYAAAAWLQRADLNGSLLQFLNPLLEPEERQLAAVKGWILGIV